ncbi:hypothetical protein [Paracoccus shandongensis]|uniref:hypothetical protein n=1 Tax=Paracoccus shandongensis TaxID=2816048 RepID=UPI001A8FE9A1|nr:hypothetical protein [Paracoccus shandongensis]
MKKQPLNLSLDIGADAVPVPAPPPSAAAKKGPGRPPIPPRENARRIAVTVDGELYRKIRIACAELDIDRQTFLERSIALMFADIQKLE